MPIAPPLPDVKAAFDAVPRMGRDTEFAGMVVRDSNPNTHIQGLAPYREYFLLTHSDRSQKAGRVLIVSREAGSHTLVAEHLLPIVSQEEPFYFHAGGCQLFGDCLVVPMEASSQASVIVFLDVSNPLSVRELDPGARILRNSGTAAKKAGAVGVTTFAHNGTDACLLSVHDRGSVDFYRTTVHKFPRGFQLIATGRVPQNEREHQALCLLTDTENRVYGLGLNRTATGTDKIVLYEIDPDSGSLARIGERQLTTTGGRPYATRPHFRWGGGLEITASSDLVLHCTSHRYDQGCHINMFDPRLPELRRAIRPTKATKPQRRRPAKATAKRPARKRARKIASRR
jgi:hypothetical protein